jgi:hypothetical protein
MSQLLTDHQDRMSGLHSDHTGGGWARERVEKRAEFSRRLDFRVGSFSCYAYRHDVMSPRGSQVNVEQGGAVLIIFIPCCFEQSASICEM